MSGRKLFLFNPVNYKIKKMFVLIGIILIFNFCIIFLSYYLISAVQSYNSRNTADLKKAVETDNNIINSFLILSQKSGSDKYSLATDKIQKDHKTSMDTVNAFIENIDSENRKSQSMFKIFVSVITVLTLLTFLSIIMIFSKIVGPAFYINRLIEKHLNGENVTPHELRNGDEFEDLYKNVKRLINKKNMKTENISQHNNSSA